MESYKHNKMSVDGSPTNVKAEMLPHKIGFVGSGKMALALAKGFMSEGLVSPSQVNLSTNLFASLRFSLCLKVTSNPLDQI